MSIGKGCAAAALAVGLAFGLTAADARQWNPTPQALAQDYLQILHMKPGGEVVMVQWFAPPMVAAQPEAAELLDKYVLIAVVHARLGPGGTMLFDDIPPLKATDGDGTPLKLLTGGDIPKNVAQGVQALNGMLKQSIGAMGQGMKFFVFEPGAVKACGKGKLSIPYAGETYTYDTPIPGCQAQ
jgi:hypothetical protein